MSLLDFLEILRQLSEFIFQTLQLLHIREVWSEINSVRLDLRFAHAIDLSLHLIDEYRSLLARKEAILQWRAIIELGWRVQNLQ